MIWFNFQGFILKFSKLFIGDWQAELASTPVFCLFPLAFSKQFISPKVSVSAHFELQKQSELAAEGKTCTFGSIFGMLNQVTHMLKCSTAAIWSSTWLHILAHYWCGSLWQAIWDAAEMLLTFGTHDFLQQGTKQNWVGSWLQLWVCKGLQWESQGVTWESLGVPQGFGGNALGLKKSKRPLTNQYCMPPYDIPWYLSNWVGRPESSHVFQEPEKKEEAWVSVSPVAHPSCRLKLESNS